MHHDEPLGPINQAGGTLLDGLDGGVPDRESVDIGDQVDTASADSAK